MKSDIPHHIATCIASQQRGNSETQQKVINLGKNLISEYKLDKGTDTLVRWLIHYIAEKMELLSNSEGHDKTIAEQQCVDAILKLWSHKSFLPDGIRPFENFDSVLLGLARLDNSSPSRYYNEFHQFDQAIADDENNETKRWVNFAIKIDEAARALVGDFFKIAAEHAKDKKTREILDNSPDPSEDHVRILFKLYSEDGSQSSEEKLREQRRSDLEKKLERANAMEEICRYYAGIMRSELEKVDDVMPQEK